MAIAVAIAAGSDIAELCGVTVTPGWLQSRDSTGSGSTSKTSSVASFYPR